MTELNAPETSFQFTTLIFISSGIQIKCWSRNWPKGTQFDVKEALIDPADQVYWLNADQQLGSLSALIVIIIVGTPPK